MGIKLFEHNKVAYEAVLKMLNKTGKAAIVHPTGTGKSFIGFKLSEDFSDKKICWLAPSEYIFKTQLENLKKSSDNYEPQNIEFLTYAKLMMMSEEEMLQINPDYIILDEFHRCGAQMWGQGIQSLISLYSNTPVLGLSATAIRYLDNQRNMTDELFDGNVASEMTLGEAIVRGILNMPTYVLSIYSYQKDLEKYERRISGAKSKIVRDAAQKYLDALRRALDKADGLDVIFDKYMNNKHGKYIVFTANYEHMCEMMDMVPEWFAQVDKNPHIYRAYSDSPEASKDFADFKADDSEHLKLLFCIDMLNEGIHVEDISGVILLRPTISPIIYKQQIGRALSASKNGNAVIFDIVLNIENLYSIGAIEEEMQLALTYYRSMGLDDEVVNEHFRVVDEVRDCISLFDKLHDTLNASWDLMYDVAKKFYQENGNLEIPKRFVTAEGFALGSWLNTQRLVHEGKAHGSLNDEQVKKLEKIGMRWENMRDVAWEKYFSSAQKYYNEYGHLQVNVSENDYDGVALGSWLSRLRVYRKSGVQSAYLTPDRIAALDKLHMVWDVPNYLWEMNYHAAVEYHRTHGNLDVPSYYVTEEGIRLGAWLCGMRDSRNNKASKRARITDEQIARLDLLGFSWKNKHNAAWEKSFEAACAYKKKYGNLDIPVAYVTEEGCRLGRWIRRQRDNCSTLSEERRQKLSELGMIWDVPDSWKSKFALVQKYFDENGHINMPGDYVVDGVWLARWLYEQVARLNGKSKGRNGKVKTLTKEQVEMLRSVGKERSAG